MTSRFVRPKRRAAGFLAVLGSAVLLLAQLVTAQSVPQQTRPATPSKPEPIIGADYPQAFKYTPENLRPYLYDTTVNANWLGQSDVFWYSFRTSKGTNYYRVDARKGTKEALFDQEKMAALLSEQSHKPLEPISLPMRSVSVTADGTKMRFISGDFQYEYDLKAEKLTKGERAEPEPAVPAGRGGRGQQDNQQQQQQQQDDQQRQQDDQQQQQQQQQQQVQQQQQQQQQQKDQQQKDQQQKDQQRRGNQNKAGGRGGRGGVEGLRSAAQEGQGGRGGAGGAANANANDGYRAFSPDRKLFVFAKNHNLYVAEADKESEAVQITTDGAESYSFAGGGGGAGGLQQQQQEQQRRGLQQQQQKDGQQKGEQQKDGQQKGEQQKDGQQKGEQQKGEQQKGDSQKDGLQKGDVQKGGQQKGGKGKGTQKGRGGRGGAGGNPNNPSLPAVVWAPDSKAFHITRTDSREVGELYLVNALSQPRPTLTSYAYPMPGEENVRKPELWVYNCEQKKIERVEPKWKDETYRDVHWEKTASELRFLRRDRPQRSIEICTYNALTKECKCLLMESFDAANLSPQPIRYLVDTGEMLWWSERSGWGHYYLYERDGKLKNAITSGNWHVGSVVAVDNKNRVAYVRGNGREPGENVYYNHLYRVNLDGTNLTLLDPGNANHTSSLSPSKQFVIDHYDRIDQAPATVLRDATGRKIMDLEQADLTRLYETGWKLPETFMVKAADGVTDIYGNMWKPYNFDPTKKYPIIAHVYPGPQTESITFNFAPTNGNQALAQLGFIVIHVGNRGGSPNRSKAYESFGYFNLRDYALADKKAAIEQLAARHPFIDIDRVGIYGHSGGGFLSAAALLQKPYNEFFKVAVASAGNHDNNIYNQNWSEQHHGLREVPVNQATTGATAERGGAGRGTGGGGRGGGGRGRRGGGADDAAAQDQQQQQGQDKTDQEKKDQDKDKTDQEKKEAKPETKFQIHVPSNAELAANLTGHLLLVHGDMDNNVHPANTIRLVDALIRANKRFDMLIMPGKAHGFADFQPYFTQRMWDFFTEHLLHERQTSANIYEKTKSASNGSSGISSTPR